MGTGQEVAGNSQDYETTIKGTIAAVTWVSLNILLNFANKTLFAGKHEHFQFPIFIIMLGTAFTFFGVLCMYLAKLPFVGTFKREACLKSWKLILFLAFCHAFTTGLINMSMVYLSISLTQIIKTLTPAAAVLLCRFFLGSSVPTSQTCSIMVIIFGAAITLFENPEFLGDHVHQHLFGLFCAFVSTVMGAAQVVVTGVLLQNANLDTYSLIVVTAIPQILSLLPLFFIFEFSSFIYSPPWNLDIALLLSFTFIGAFFYTLASYFLVQYTSAVFAATVGNIKIVLLVFLSMIVFKVQVSVLNVFGILIALFGFAAYNWLKLQERLAKYKNSQPPNINPTPTADKEAEACNVEHIQNMKRSVVEINSQDLEEQKINSQI